MSRSLPVQSVHGSFEFDVDDDTLGVRYYTWTIVNTDAYETIDQVFEALQRRITFDLRNSYSVVGGIRNRTPLEIEVIPVQGDPLSRPGYITSFQGNFLANWFENMKKSQEMMDNPVDGTIIRVHEVGQLLADNRRRGRCQPAKKTCKFNGYKFYRMTCRKEQQVRDLPCLITAFIRLTNPLFSIKKKWYMFMDECKRVQLAINQTELSMDTSEISRILELPEFKSYRVLFVNSLKEIYYRCLGSEFQPLDREVEDPKTAYIFHHEDHFYTITSIKEFKDKDSHVGNRFCYECLTTMRGTKFNSHECQGKIACSKCSQCEMEFHSSAIQELHMKSNKKLEKKYECKFCERQDFYSSHCLEYHVKECRVDKSRASCIKCKREFAAYRTTHTCVVHCKYCGEKFDGWVDYKECGHTCYMKRSDAKYETFKQSNNVKTWKMHCAYDFETYRCLKEVTSNGVSVYKHDVMQWEIGILNIGESKEYMESGEFIDYIREKLPSNVEMFYDEGDVYFRGGTLKSFMDFISNVLNRREKGLQWHPTLWAHNGSRFDAKFILAYWLKNGKELAGAKYIEEFDCYYKDKEEKWVKEKRTIPDTKVVTASMIGSKILKISNNNVVSLAPLFMLCCIDNTYFHPEMNKENEQKLKVEEVKSGETDSTKLLSKENILEKKSSNEINLKSSPNEQQKEEIKPVLPIEENNRKNGEKTV